MPDYQHPWHKLLTESGKNFHKFLHYLNLLPFERSMDRAHSMHQWVCLKKLPEGAAFPQKLIGCSSDWYDLKFKFTWTERADAWDQHVAEVDRLTKIQKIKDMNERHIEFAMGLQSLGIERLKQYTAHATVAVMTPTQLANLLDKASTVERRAMGEATQILAKAGDNANDAMALDLSKLDETELSVFQSLVNKARPGAALPEPSDVPEVLPALVKK